MVISYLSHITNNICDWQMHMLGIATGGIAPRQGKVRQGGHGVKGPLSRSPKYLGNKLFICWLILKSKNISDQLQSWFWIWEEFFQLPDRVTDGTFIQRDNFVTIETVEGTENYLGIQPFPLEFGFYLGADIHLTKAAKIVTRAGLHWCSCKCQPKAPWTGQAIGLCFWGCNCILWHSNVFGWDNTFKCHTNGEMWRYVTWADSVKLNSIHALKY